MSTRFEPFPGGPNGFGGHVSERPVGGRDLTREAQAEASTIPGLKLGK